VPGDAERCAAGDDAKAKGDASGAICGRGRDDGAAGGAFGKAPGHGSGDQVDLNAGQEFIAGLEAAVRGVVEEHNGGDLVGSERAGPDNGLCPLDGGGLGPGDGPGDCFAGCNRPFLLISGRNINTSETRQHTWATVYCVRVVLSREGRSRGADRAQVAGQDGVGLVGRRNGLIPSHGIVIDFRFVQTSLFEDIVIPHGKPFGSTAGQGHSRCPGALDGRGFLDRTEPGHHNCGGELVADRAAFEIEEGRSAGDAGGPYSHQQPPGLGTPLALSAKHHVSETFSAATPCAQTDQVCPAT
jgi:hypothetical protein